MLPGSIRVDANDLAEPDWFALRLALGTNGEGTRHRIVFCSLADLALGSLQSLLVLLITMAGDGNRLLPEKAATLSLSSWIDSFSNDSLSFGVILGIVVLVQRFKMNVSLVCLLLLLYKSRKAPDLKRL